MKCEIIIAIIFEFSCYRWYSNKDEGRDVNCKQLLHFNSYRMVIQQLIQYVEMFLEDRTELLKYGSYGKHW